MVHVEYTYFLNTRYITMNHSDNIQSLINKLINLVNENKVDETATFVNNLINDEQGFHDFAEYIANLSKQELETYRMKVKRITLIQRALEGVFKIVIVYFMYEHSTKIENIKGYMNYLRKVLFYCQIKAE